MNRIVLAVAEDQVDQNMGSPKPMNVAVAYQDSETRERAIQLCDRMVHQYWGEIDVEFSWWKLGYLSDVEVLREATQAAERSDVLVFSVEEGFAPSLEVNSWIEQWTKN